MGTTDNTFTNSGPGEQNSAQGDGSIGKKIDNSQDVTGDGNIVAGSGDVNIEHYHAAAQKPKPPDQRPALEPCFLHREEEITWLNERLHPGAVAAVCGPGGMGKSALAAQAVSKLEPTRFPDGIIFHSFYHQPSAEQALQAVCAAFQAEAKTDLIGGVRQALSGRKALLMLDGTEEADDLQAVLRLRGQCGVLITSRKNEDAPDAPLELKPLDEQPAAEVFHLYSGLAADDASVAAICKLLGGWPVGLRIAGRYLSSTDESAADYLEWLVKEPFKELGDGEHQEENAALLLRRSVAAVSTDARLALRLMVRPVALGEADWGTFIWGGGAWLTYKRVTAYLDGDEYRARKALNELVNYGLLEKRDKYWSWSHRLIYTYAHKYLRRSKGI
jgi:hypothetical protein